MDFKKISKAIKEKRKNSETPEEEMVELQKCLDEKNKETYEKYNTKKDRVK